MDMESGHAVIGFDHFLKCLVRDGEQSMSAEHRFDHIIVFFDSPFSKLSVLLYALKCLFFSVSFGYLIAEAGSHSEFLRYILDRKQRAWDLTEACVMVKYRCDTVSDTVEYRRVRACLSTINSQMSVDRPPCAVEHLEEIGRIVSFNCQTSGKSGVNMCMRIDQSRHDDAALRIYKFSIRIGSFHICQRSHCFDDLAVDHDSTVFMIRECRISCNKLPITY